MGLDHIIRYNITIVELYRMGDLEKKEQERIRRTRIQRAVLESVKLAGVLSVAMLAPNAIQVLKGFGVMQKRRQKEYVRSSAAKLTEKGFLKFNSNHYELTGKGEKILQLWSVDDYRLEKPKKWDGKWRLIIFDIPEKKAGVRRKIPSIFTRAGLYRLQDSIWIYPYDCEDIIGLLKTDLGVGKDLLYVIADEIENDKYLRAHFDLYS